MLTVEQRDQLAGLLDSTTVPQLTYAVHMRDKPTIANLLDDLDRQELMALAVVLASRCPRPLVRPNDGVVDEIAVARACAGELAPLTGSERLEAVRLLHARGCGASQISKRLHIAGTTAKRLIDKIDAGQGAAR